MWYHFRAGVRLRPPDRAPLATELALRDTRGNRVSLESYRGHVVLLNLWASWCEPCRVEIPRLARVASEFAADGLVVLGLNAEFLPPQDLERLGRQLGIRYHNLILIAPLSGTFVEAGVIPQTWLIDRRGRVRASHVGLATESSLRRACRTLLDEGPIDRGHGS